jgi:hypothetical protein
MEPEFGVIEIGHIWFGVPLQRTTTAHGGQQPKSGQRVVRHD